MTSTGHLANNHHDVKEFDSVKESISDIINQLQDIDPARLSFSPFLDLDTQISLAPVSDSPESSVEELRSPSHSVPGSQHSLEPLTTGDHVDQGLSCQSRSCDNFAEPPQQTEQGELEDTVASNIPLEQTLEEDPSENYNRTPLPDSQGDIPNGRDREQWNPLESTNLESTVDEGHPLIRALPECIEMGVWDPQEEGECEAIPDTAERERCCCCRCCRSGRIPALCSVLGSLLFLPGILYALYFYVPLDAPHCPDLVSRLSFTLQCCAVAAVPVLLGMITGAVSRFCTASLDPVQVIPRRPVLLQLFVTASLEQLCLYTLNLVVMATFLPQAQLKACLLAVTPRLQLMARVWLRAYFFPLLVMVVFNLYFLFELGFSKLFPGTEDTLSVLSTPSPWPLQMPRGLRDTADQFLPTDRLDIQRGRG